MSKNMLFTVLRTLILPEKIITHVKNRTLQFCERSKVVSMRFFKTFYTRNIQISQSAFLIKSLLTKHSRVFLH